MTQLKIWQYHYIPIKPDERKRQKILEGGMEGRKEKKWQYQILAKMQRNWIYCTLLAGIQNGAAIMENSLASSEIKHALAIQPRNCTVGHLYQN